MYSASFHHVSANQNCRDLYDVLTNFTPLCNSWFCLFWAISYRCDDDKPFVPTYQVSKEKAKSLGVEFTPLEEGIKETVESLKEKNLFKPTSAIWMPHLLLKAILWLVSVLYKYPLFVHNLCTWHPFIQCNNNEFVWCLPMVCRVCSFGL